MINIFDTEQPEQLEKALEVIYDGISKEGFKNNGDEIE